MKDRLQKIGSSIKLIDSILQIIIQSGNISLDIFEFQAISGSSAVTLKVGAFLLKAIRWILSQHLIFWFVYFFEKLCFIHQLNIPMNFSSRWPSPEILLSLLTVKHKNKKMVAFLKSIWKRSIFYDNVSYKNPPEETKLVFVTLLDIIPSPSRPRTTFELCLCITSSFPTPSGYVISYVELLEVASA